MTLVEDMMERLWEAEEENIDLVMSFVPQVIDQHDWDEVANEGETPYNRAQILVWRFIDEGWTPQHMREYFP